MTIMLFRCKIIEWAYEPDSTTTRRVSQIRNFG